MKFALSMLFLALVICVANASAKATNNAQLQDELFGHKSLFSNLFGNFNFAEIKNKTAAILNKAITRQAYEKYLVLFGKSYTNLHEPSAFERRFKLFADRVKMIVKSKIDYLTGKSSYALGINKFTDWFDEEFRTNSQKALLIKSGNSSSLFDTLRNKYSHLANSVVGSSQEPELITNGVDLRSTGCITPVRNQGKCGSCWAFAAAALVESSICLTPELNPDKSKAEHLSTQELLDCCIHDWSGEKFTCQSGGSMDVAFDHIFEKTHVIKEDCYKYIANNSGQCKPDRDDESCFVRVRTHLQKFHMETLEDESSIEEHLSKGPVAVSVDTERSIRLYERGILTDHNNFEPIGKHAMLIVGHGTSERGFKYWLVKNSHGNDTALGGYMKIERGKNAFQIQSAATGLIFK